jgi:hypothetical protein
VRGARAPRRDCWRFSCRVLRVELTGFKSGCPGRVSNSPVWWASTIAWRDRGARTGDPAATVKATAADVPDRWGLLSIKPGNVRVASFFGLMESAAHDSPLAAPLILDSWVSAANGDPSGLWLQSLVAQIALPEEQVWGDVAAVGRVDAGDAGPTFAPSANRGSIIGNPGTDVIWAGGSLTDAWPAEPDEDESAGLFAVFTTIISSTAGANLILLVLDTARDRTARELAAPTPRPAVTSAGA